MITSTSNAQVKDVINLKKKASERKKRGLFIVEGERIVREIPWSRVERLYVAESFAASHATLTDVEGVAHTIATEAEIVSDRVFETMADTMSPQGVLAVVRMLTYSLEELLKENAAGEGSNQTSAKKGSEASLFLILEHLQDPGNLGTILRTAEGAGVTALLMSADTVDIYNPKVTRATMGSLFRVPFLYVEDLPATLETLKKHGVQLCAAHLSGEHNYFEEDYTSPTGFLIGNEGNGLTDEITALCDKKVRIPMEGKLESLNAAVSAALFMYEAKRQRS